MVASKVKRAVLAFGSPKRQRLLAYETTIHIVVAEDVMARPVEPIPDVQEGFIFGIRTAEITQLYHEIDLLSIHTVDEGFEPLVGVVHDTLVDVRTDA